MHSVELHDYIFWTIEIPCMETTKMETIEQYLHIAPSMLSNTNNNFQALLFPVKNACIYRVASILKQILTCQVLSRLGKPDPIH